MNLTVDVMGYVGYGILCLLTLRFVVFVRTQLTAGIHMILSSLTFLIAAVLLPSLGIPLINAWWIIPAVYGLVMFVYIPIMAYRVPLLWSLLHVIGSLYVAIVRIGISSKQIEAARDAELYTWLHEHGCNEEETERVLQMHARVKAHEARG